MGIGGGCDHFGLNLPQHRLGAAALQTVDVEATMQKLEFEMKFARDELKSEYDTIIADLEDEDHEESKRKLKKASVLVDMKVKRENGMHMSIHTHTFVVL